MASGATCGQRVPVGFFRYDRCDRLRDVFAAERAHAGEQFVEHDAERPDVGAPVDYLAAGLLRRMYAAVPRTVPAAWRLR